MTDDGLKVLEQLTELRVIQFMEQQFSDAGTAHLAGLTKLEELWLDFNRNVGDGTMQAVRNLKKLRVLRFYQRRSPTPASRRSRILRNLNSLILEIHR